MLSEVVTLVHLEMLRELAGWQDWVKYWVRTLSVCCFRRKLPPWLNLVNKSWTYFSLLLVRYKLLVKCPSQTHYVVGRVRAQAVVDES
jgi:hypothetical protein